MKVEFRPVRDENEIMDTAMIYVDCWKHDYANLIPQNVLNRLDITQEANECREWLQSDERNMMYAAFSGQKMIGYTAVAANHNAESELLDYDAELTGFFVRKEYRNYGIGLKLLYDTVDQLKSRGSSSLLVYNFKSSQSNSYYKGLGGITLLQVTQYSDGKALDVEVFGFQLDRLCATLKGRLQKYSNQGLCNWIDISIKDENR